MPHTILYLNAEGEISGAERSLLAMLDALDRGRWRAVVAAPEGALLDAVRARGVAAAPVALTRPKRPRNPAQGVRFIQQMITGRGAVHALVEAWQPAVLHANTTAAMLHAPHTPGLPVIWHVRDLQPLGQLGRAFYQRAARVAVISETVRAAVARAGAGDGGAKIRLLPPAVDTAHFKPAEDRAAVRAALGLPVDRPLIGLVAQFVPWKRHHLFLDALLPLIDLPWHAVLAGAELDAPTGQGKAYQVSLRERLAAPPLAERITWLPWQEDAAPLLAALNLLVLTSQREPFGRVVIEALACGVPVVAVNEGGPREMLHDGITGRLVPAKPPALAGAILDLLIDPTRCDVMGIAGREAVATTYSLPVQREALTRVYEECLG
jgi:glycosyltransferase involved in cell wall biosynthesis